MPDALNAVISLSEDSLPKVIKTVINTAIGIAKEMIHAELYNKNLKTIPIDKPFPRNLSMFFKIKFDSNTKIRINKELKNGMNNSLSIYLFMILFN